MKKKHIPVFFCCLLVLQAMLCHASTPPDQKQNAPIQQDTPSLLFLDTWTGRQAMMEEVTAPAPVAFMTPVLVTTQTICLGQSVQLTAPSTGARRYSWSPATGLDDSNIYNPIAMPTTSTVYTLSVYDADWNVTQFVYIINVSVPIASAGPDVYVCSGDSAQFFASGGVSYSWSPAAGLNSTTVANPLVYTTATTTYTVTVTNMSGCTATDQVTVYVTRALDIRVILQGPYNASTNLMDNYLQVQGIIPTAQPYSPSTTAIYSGPPYSGTETMSTSLTVDIVDWILVELRTSNMATTATIGTVIAKRAGLLKTDGHIVDTDGVSPLTFTEITSSTASHYIVIRHRNHLAVMSSSATYFPTGQCLQTYNFTNYAAAFRYPPESGFYMISQIQVDSSPDTWAMVAGDLNVDGVINATDRADARDNIGALGYFRFDCSLDGIVNAVERVTTRMNTFRFSQVP
jgi:hypothetical protein